MDCSALSHNRMVKIILQNILMMENYMGRYADWAYWFVRDTVWQVSVAISKSAEQAVWWVGQKLLSN